jgi:hypothetical protein
MKLSVIIVLAASAFAAVVAFFAGFASEQRQIGAQREISRIDNANRAVADLGDKAAAKSLAAAGAGGTAGGSGARRRVQQRADPLYRD